MRWTVRLETMTDRGAMETTELATISRPAAMDTTLEDVGLALAEAKALLAALQESMVQSQLTEYVAARRVCPSCGVPQPLKDRRTRRIQTLFGTVAVAAPRSRVCHCRRLTATVPEAAVSPVCALLTARCTPELERVQAELGARTAFREAARILRALLPASPANQESVRRRTHAVAVRLEAADRQAAAVTACPRRFALVRSVAKQPHALLRAVLLKQGWQEEDAVTAISDGDPALPALVRAATRGPVEHILDWFHLSMRVRHVEQVFLGLHTLEPTHHAPLDDARVDVERLRHLLWNDRHEEASAALVRIAGWAESAAVLGGAAAMAAKAGRLVALCAELRAYVEANTGALIDYGERCRAGQPISTSRAEGTVNQLVNARMNKRKQMRWSPLGAHRVLQVRVAVLNGRFGLGQQAVQLAAA